MSDRFKRYSDYLLSDHWSDLKKKCRKRDGGCVSCIALKLEPEGWLNGHHLRYKQLYDCIEDDVTTLCGSCHNTFHVAVRDFAIHPHPETVNDTVAVIGRWLSSGKKRIRDRSNGKIRKQQRIQQRAAARRHNGNWPKKVGPVLAKFKRMEPSEESIDWLVQQLTAKLNNWKMAA